jgi:hypothetical protein
VQKYQQTYQAVILFWESKRYRMIWLFLESLIFVFPTPTKDNQRGPNYCRVFNKRFGFFFVDFCPLKPLECNSGWLWIVGLWFRAENSSLWEVRWICWNDQLP